MKRIITTLLVFVLVTLTFGDYLSVKATTEEKELIITVDTVRGERGSEEEITVCIDISDNPGIVNAKLSIAFPSEKLELLSVEDTGLLRGYIIKPNYKEGAPIVVVWQDGLGNNNTQNGTVLKLKFKIKKYVINDTNQLGMANITLSYETGDITNFNLDDIEAKIVNGGIDIYCDHTYSNYVSNGDATCKQDGTKSAWCDKGCGQKNTLPDEGSMLQHKYSNYEPNNDATCLKDGTETASCDYGCNTKNTRTDVGSMLSHEYTNYVYNNDATYFEHGTETASCNHGCGTTDTRVKQGSKLENPKNPDEEVEKKYSKWKNVLEQIQSGEYFGK